MHASEKTRLDLEKQDLRTVLSTENGRRFIWRLLTYCGVHRDIHGSEQEIYRQLGQRNVGLFIEGIIADVDEEMFFTMMREALIRTQEENYQVQIERQKQEAEGLRGYQNNYSVEQYDVI